MAESDLIKYILFYGSKKRQTKMISVYLHANMVHSFQYLFFYLN